MVFLIAVAALKVAAVGNMPLKEHSLRNVEGRILIHIPGKLFNILEVGFYSIAPLLIKVGTALAGVQFFLCQVNGDKAHRRRVFTARCCRWLCHLLSNFDRS